MPSTSIDRADYDPAEQILRIRYVGGGTYDYLDVPPQTFEAYRAAFSKGRFVNAVIKPNFAYRRLEQGGTDRRKERDH
jgi:hypothetical protein